MLPVAADPDPVDQTLIVGVHGDGVLAGVDEFREVDLVVEVVKTVAGGRSLRDENAVHVEFVVVVGADAEDHIFRFRQRELFPEKDVAVLQLRGGFRLGGAVELAVKHILRNLVEELFRGDPVPGENFRFILHGEIPCIVRWIVCAMRLLYRSGGVLPVGERVFPILFSGEIGFG